MDRVDTRDVDLGRRIYKTSTREATISPNFALNFAQSANRINFGEPRTSHLAKVCGFRFTTYVFWSEIDLA